MDETISRTVFVGTSGEAAWIANEKRHEAGSCSVVAAETGAIVLAMLVGCGNESTAPPRQGRDPCPRLVCGEKAQDPTTAMRTGAGRIRI